MNSLCFLPVFSLSSRTEHHVCIQSDNGSQLLLEKGEKKRGMKPSFEGFNNSLFCIGHVLLNLFSGAVKRVFLRSVADVLTVSFRARTENCLCGKSGPGSCSVVIKPALSAPVNAQSRAKSVRGASSSSYGCATCLSPPLCLSGGRSEKERERAQGWDAQVVLVSQEGRMRLFWSWLLRVVGAALVSGLAGRVSGDGDATVGGLNLVTVR